MDGTLICGLLHNSIMSKPYICISSSHIYSRLSYQFNRTLTLFRKVNELEAQRKESSERLCLRAGEAQKIRETLASEVCVRSFITIEMKVAGLTYIYIVFSQFLLSKFHQHTHTHTQSICICNDCNSIYFDQNFFKLIDNIVVGAVEDVEVHQFA
jgi:hypothetical protein